MTTDWQVYPHCRDCDRNVSRLHEFAWMVHDRVWQEATRRAQRVVGTASTRDLCCIPCFEGRLGRPLQRADFDWSVPLNFMRSYRRSTLLRKRMRA